MKKFRLMSRIQMALIFALLFLLVTACNYSEKSREEDSEVSNVQYA